MQRRDQCATYKNSPPCAWSACLRAADYFRDIAAAMPTAGPPDFQKVVGIMERYGLRLVR